MAASSRIYPDTTQAWSQFGTVCGCRFSNEGKACSVTTDGYYDDTEWGDNGWRTSRGHFK